MYTHMNRWLSLLLLIVVSATECSLANEVAAVASSSVVANADFDQGDTAPMGWTLSGGTGGWVDRSTLEVIGNGNDDNRWRCECRFTPGGLYRLEARARSLGGGGVAVFGTDFATADPGLSANWNWIGQVFRVPDGVESDCLKLGQWHARGSIQYDAVRLTPVMPVYAAVGPLWLGEGEVIEGGRYTFVSEFGRGGGNFHRPLLNATAGFLTDRWWINGENEVVYRFNLPGHSFTSGKVAFSINYHQRGSCAVEISRDGTVWRTLTSRDSVGYATAELPADLLPAETLYLRLRGTDTQGVLQVNQAEFSAVLSGAATEGRGRTEFWAVVNNTSDLTIEQLAVDDLIDPSRPGVRLTVKNRTPDAVQAAFSVQTVPGDADSSIMKGKTTPDQSGPPVNVAPGQSQTFTATVPQQQVGACKIRAVLSVAGKEAIVLSMPWWSSELYRNDYGERIAGVGGDAEVWWCDAAWKVARNRPAPQAASPAATLSAARGDHEGVQVVLRPTKPLRQLTASVDALSGPDGATIPAEKVEVLRVYYHLVQTPTDSTGVRGWWPDALPPLNKPLDLAAGENQPLWVLVHVPRDAKAGDYAGNLSLKAEGWSADVPIKLHVWNFALPETNHIETAFGLNINTPFRYQQVKTEADRRRLADMYLQSFADHRVSPYNPTPLDPIVAKFVPEADPPRAEFDFSVFDAAMSRSLEKYHFTNFVVPLHGMGGGDITGQSSAPQIGDFTENTPQYQAMFSSYVKQLESHLREKNWLKKAYTYWYDEPVPKDYAFVQAGMDRLKKYAPGIQTMITKHELQDDWTGTIDIWCPLSPDYNRDVAEKRQARGERYWWYVCCAPKAPFCTSFLDHPATDLRVWLWQTWQRDIAGILIWESVYWTSREDLSQNPYEDPMGYVGGTKPEQRQYWSNGEGRFLYPPLAAATPGLSGSDPVIEPPVSSIRWEMLREGVEDCEFLWLLRDLIGKKRSSLTPEQVKVYEALLEVPEAITRDMTTFSTDPQPIYARRAAIAEAIEQLNK